MNPTFLSLLYKLHDHIQEMITFLKHEIREKPIMIPDPYAIHLLSA